VRRFLDLNGSLLSPLLAFTAGWLFVALLSQFHLLSGQSEWSTVMIAVVAVVPIAFVAGGLAGEGIALRFSGEVTRSDEMDRSTRLFRRILVVFLAIGLLELAHQFVKIGGIPLLSPGGNVLRFNQGGATIVLTDLLTVAAIAALVKPRNLLARESRFELMVAGIALMGFALQAGRGSLILPVIVATAARWLYWGRPKAWLIGGAGLIAFAAIVFGFYLRARQNPFNPFEAELFSEVLPGTPFFLQPLVPIYLALATNFLALQGVVGYFPTGAPFGHGVFDTLALNSVIGNAQNLSDISATLTPPWVTSTVAGPFWADGGFLVLVLGIAITGFLSAGAFAMAARTRSLRWSMVAAYLLYLALFGLYANLWTQQIDWLIVVPLLLIVGAFAEDPASPPGLTGRAWARIRSMRGVSELDPPAVKAAPESPPKADRKLARGLVLSGVAIVAVLLISALAVQRLLPEPYPLIASNPLPASASDATAVMTDSNVPADNQSLQWVDADEQAVELFSYQPDAPQAGATTQARIQIPDRGRRTSFDIGYWPPWREPALFSLDQRPNRLLITASPTNRSEAEPDEHWAPISAASPGTVNTEMIASWSGPKPDLFIVTRGSFSSRAQIRILSGESRFRKQLFVSPLPFRGLGPDGWSMDVGQIATIPKTDEQRAVRGDRADLLLVHHTPDKEHSDVQVLLGESGFQWDAFQRDLDTPGAVPPGTEFMLGSHQGASAVYEVRRHGASSPRLQIFGLENPPQFK
jgi:oligosaccharide repeat unit polymerase